MRCFIAAVELKIKITTATLVPNKKFHATVLPDIALDAAVKALNILVLYPEIFQRFFSDYRFCQSALHKIFTISLYTLLSGLIRRANTTLLHWQYLRLIKWIGEFIICGGTCFLLFPGYGSGNDFASAECAAPGH